MMDVKHLLQSTLLAALLSLFCTHTAHACPEINGLIDYNCDQKIRIGVLGDSFVFGTGDKRTGSKGGYVGRLAKLPQFKNAEIIGMGLPGYSSFEILIEIRRSLGLSKPNRLKRSLTDLDILIVDLGRNDFFQNISPTATVNNIRSLVTSINQRVGHGAKLPPLFAVAKLPSTSPSRRPLQRAFISKIDALLAKKSSNSFPVSLNFAGMAPRLLSTDGLHPNPSGYAFLTQVASRYLLGDAQQSQTANRTDEDNDGVYDQAERKVFRTDPTLADTDGDGLIDGDEIFGSKTDPLVADTDGDGFSDGAEVAALSNPLDASSIPAQ